MTLTEKLNKLLEVAEQRVPQELWVLMKRANRELEESGIMERVLKKGGSMPSFELPAVDGRLVRSADLLERGNLVLTFYRGVW